MAKGMPNLDASIRDKVDLLIRRYLGAPEAIQNGKIAIQFYDVPLKRRKKPAGSGWGRMRKRINMPGKNGPSTYVVFLEKI